MKEKWAIFSVMAVLISVPAVVLWYREFRPSARHTERVISITGVAASGTWTLENVTAANYWWKRFEPANIYIELGERVVLQFRSADVFHQFYAPALNIGPIDVEPGYVKEIVFEPRKAGVFQYYCTSLCGGCHFYMRGWILVYRRGERPPIPPLVGCPLCLPDFGAPPEKDPIALGEYLYRSTGCITCHGIDGRGGIENYNYINGHVPAHDRMASKIFLNQEEDAQAFLDLVGRGEDLLKPSKPPEIVRFALVRSRTAAAVKLIEIGKNAAPADPSGPEPPLQMPQLETKIKQE